MRTAKNIMAIDSDRAKPSVTKRRIVVVGLALGILRGHCPVLRM